MLEKIKKLVELETKIEDISTKSRKPDNVNARVIYFYLARTHTSKSFEQIARLVNRDHSTGVHSMKIYNAWRDLPKYYTAELSKLHEIENLLADTKKEDIKPLDLHDMFKVRNTILEKEITELRLEIKNLEGRLKHLKRFEPIL